MPAAAIIAQKGPQMPKASKIMNSRIMIRGSGVSCRGGKPWCLEARCFLSGCKGLYKTTGLATNWASLATQKTQANFIKFSNIIPTVCQTASPASAWICLHQAPRAERTTSKWVNHHLPNWHVQRARKAAESCSKTANDVRKMMGPTGQQLPLLWG